MNEAIYTWDAGGRVKKIFVSRAKAIKKLKSEMPGGVLRLYDLRKGL